MRGVWMRTTPIRVFRFACADRCAGRIIIYSILNWNYFYVKTCFFSLEEEHENQSVGDDAGDDVDEDDRVARHIRQYNFMYSCACVRVCVCMCAHEAAVMCVHLFAIGWFGDASTQTRYHTAGQFMGHIIDNFRVEGSVHAIHIHNIHIWIHTIHRTAPRSSHNNVRTMCYGYLCCIVAGHFGFVFVGVASSMWMYIFTEPELLESELRIALSSPAAIDHHRCGISCLSEIPNHKIRVQH